MNYKHSISNQTLSLIFTGDLMGEKNGPQLVELTNEVLNKGIRYCLIDIADVRYINSSGIGVLITLLTKFRNKSGELFLIKPSEHVQKLLVITKLQAIFNIVDTEEQALKKIEIG